MEKLFKKNKIKVAFSICMALGLVILYFLSINTYILLSIASSLDKPSKSYYWLMERVYKICEKENCGTEILKDIEKGKNDHILNQYIHLLGIIGEKDAVNNLLMLYSEYQNNTERKSVLYSIIDGLGALGNKAAVPILDRLLTDYENYHVQVTKYSIARALYLITGKQYTYVDTSGRETKLQLSNELINAQKMIEDSRNRQRTYQEMLIIDKIYRPPDWKTF
jgi:hypothetical protein